MLETLLLLLTSHLLGDFVFQSDVLVQQKKKLAGMVRHIAIVSVLTSLLLAPTQGSAIAPIAIVAFSHFAMDYIKAHWLKDTLWAFAGDQAFHFATIAALAMVWPEMARQSLWASQPAQIQAHGYAGLALLCGLIVGVAVGGVVIRKIVEPLSPSSQNPSAVVGMKNAGRYIGWLERALTITFILIKHPEGVGLLLAAKSILRFRDVQDETDRHQAEYIIIGTFLSFGWAIVSALLTSLIIDHWLAS